MNPPRAVATSNTLPAEIDPNFSAILPALDDANPFGKFSMADLSFLGALWSGFVHWEDLRPSTQIAILSSAPHSLGRKIVPSSIL